MVLEQPQAQRLPRREMRGCTAIITGGASGLGRAIGLEFARRGVNVAFNYIELPGRDIGAQALLTETTLRSYGVQVFSAHCDVRNRDGVERFVAQVREELGEIHYLVNNAGIHHDGALWRLSEEAWREVVDTNLTGSFNCIQVVTPHFRQQHYGKIVSAANLALVYRGAGKQDLARAMYLDALTQLPAADHSLQALGTWAPEAGLTNR